MFHVRRVTSHLSLTPITTSIDLRPANISNMHRRLLSREPKTKQKMSGKKIVQTFQDKIYNIFAITAIPSLTR